MMPHTTVVLVHDFHHVHDFYQSRFSLMTNLKGLSGSMFSFYIIQP